MPEIFYNIHKEEYTFETKDKEGNMTIKKIPLKFKIVDTSARFRKEILKKEILKK